MKRALIALLALVSSCTQGEITPPAAGGIAGGPQAGGPARQRIETLAAGSECAAHDWNDRGHAPKAYVKGMALVFARSVCQRDRADVKVVSAARAAPGSSSDRTDGLTWYDAKFRALDMRNDSSGVDTLRHAYALLIGLGMRESSGRYCVGRDRSADFTHAESAEAGLLQTSWGVSASNATLPAMFARYQRDQSGCLLDVFGKNVSCGTADAKIWGEGKGAEWQKLTKACPAFAAEYGAVVLRASGGSKGEYGPIRNHAAELLPECDSMLLAVQQLVQSEPAVCSAM